MVRFTLLFLFVSITAVAQRDTTAIFDGIGIFKLGRTYDQISADLEKQQYQYITSNDSAKFSEIKNSGNQVYFEVKYNYDDPQKNLPNAISCQLTRVLYIPQFMASTSSAVTDVYLRFYKGILIWGNMGCMPDLKANIENQLGLPQVKCESAEKTCFASGKPQPYMEDYFEYTYSTNQDTMQALVSSKVSKNYRCDSTVTQSLLYYSSGSLWFQAYECEMGDKIAQEEVAKKK
ncbi:hypothetical protein BH09BAC1_BH09BAC1_22460 [soil metagenome]